jgi:hypothetical protein
MAPRATARLLGGDDGRRPVGRSVVVAGLHASRDARRCSFRLPLHDCRHLQQDGLPLPRRALIAVGRGDDAGKHYGPDGHGAAGWEIGGPASLRPRRARPWSEAEACSLRRSGAECSAEMMMMSNDKVRENRFRRAPAIARTEATMVDRDQVQQ